MTTSAVPRSDNPPASSTHKRLTPISISAITKCGNYHDGHGLYLRVRPGGSKSWAFRFKIAGQTHWMSLGPVRDVTLAEARSNARQLRNQRREGVNPLVERRKRRADELKKSGRTFDAVVKLYLEAHRTAWKNKRHAAQWASTLKTYASPVIGHLGVEEIGLPHVKRILRPIWQSKTETASRLRGRIQAVLAYASVHGWRGADNPARWTGFLDQVFPSKAKVRVVKHHAAIPWAMLPEIMAKLADRHTTSAFCLRFLILTATRSGEARGARWNEIDLAARTWTIPAERMKARVEHRIPLSEPALAILRSLEARKTRPDSLVFRGVRARSPLSDVTLSQALASEILGFTVHGCRSTFRDWCAETTDYHDGLAEAALAHANKNKIESAYRRTDLFELRGRLMGDWAAFCLSATSESGAHMPAQSARM